MAKKPKSVPVFLGKLRDHFDCDPGGLPVIERMFGAYERPNLHQAVEDAVAEGGKGALLGIIVRDEYRSATLSKLARPEGSSEFDEGPVSYVDEMLPGNRRLSCVKRGLHLFHFRKKPVALLLDQDRFTSTPGLRLEVMAATREDAEILLRLIERQTSSGDAFRGGVLSMELDCFRSLTLKFHQLPEIAREDVILPEEVLKRIERHTVDFSQQAQRLLAAGRHLKRGILLHGPPGTGKTFSAMYLASRMPERTVFLLTGAEMGMIQQAVAMARILQPATLILEDVDLIGTKRERQVVGANAVLFELLNQMDGLADDSDLLFILTTNRPDVLEPALASRPGRIDQAIEVPPPDAECRRRLIELYGKGLQLDVANLEDLVHRIEGVSAAFIRELLRKAAVHSALESEGEIIVKDGHLAAALAELMVAGGALTKSLLGASANGSEQFSEESG